MKFEGSPIEEQIRAAPTPQAARRMGRENALVTPNWDDVREQVFFEAHLAKYRQNLSCREAILRV